MDYKNKIIELAEKNNGYVRTKEITDNNILKKYLKELVDEKKILKLRQCGSYFCLSCEPYLFIRHKELAI